jgi:hypothetical protein
MLRHRELILAPLPLLGLGPLGTRGFAALSAVILLGAVLMLLARNVWLNVIGLMMAIGLAMLWVSAYADLLR